MRIKQKMRRFLNQLLRKSEKYQFCVLLPNSNIECFLSLRPSFLRTGIPPIAMSEKNITSDSLSF